MSDTYGGRLEGKFDVDGNGGATYAIPLIVPPGTGGLQPTLQLAYNSHSSELGFLGTGWRLGGLPSITRVAATIAQDGVIGRIEYGAADRFALDGARLVTTEGEYGAANAVYRPEVEQWMKVVPSGASFVAYAKDRTRYEFGGTEDSRILANTAPGATENRSVRTWLVNKITDRHGNTITIQYDRDLANNNAVPSIIKYGGNERTGAQPQREVRFAYTTLPADSPDAMPQFSGGYSWANTRLLQSVTTHVKGNLVMTYTIAYTRDAMTRLNRVTSITLADANGKALPATTFTPQDGDPTFFGHAASTVIGGNVRGQFLPMDVNGDGIPDIVNAYSESGQLKLDLYLARIDGTFAPAVSIPVTGLRDGGTLLPLDIDADGCTDLVYARSDSGQLAITVFHAREENGRWTLKEGPTGEGGPPGLRWPGILVPLDYDGDGRIDLVAGSSESGKLVIRPLRSNGTKFEHDPNAKTVTELPWNDQMPMIPIDFDGDGKGDLACARSDHNRLRVRLLRSDGTRFTAAPQDADLGEDVPYCPVLFAMDVNGDGKPDLVAARISSNMLELRTMLSNGITLEKPQLSTFSVRGDTLPRLMPARLTGGPPDLIVQTIQSDVPNLRVFSSNGAKFIERGGVAQPFTTTWLDRTLIPADIDGDGRTDLLLIGRASSTDRQLAFMTSRISGAIPNLVRRIDDGYGEQVAIEYKPLTDSTVYRKADVPAGANADPRALMLRGISGSTFDLMSGAATAGAAQSTMNVQYARQVVSAYERPGSGSTPRFRFERFYAGARVDLEGRGWLGFARMEIVDRNRNTKRVTTYRQDFPFGGSPKTAELRRASDDRLFEQITFEQRARVRGKVHEPQLIKKQRDVFGGPDPSTTPDLVEIAEMEYDDYGNTIVEAIQTTGAQTKPLFIHHTFDYDVANWNLGLEREMKRTSDRAGNEVLSHRQFQYDARANRLSDSAWDEAHKRWLEAKYEHDDYGNETSITTASGGTSRTEYDAELHTFPLRTVSPANADGITLVVDHQHDPRFGVETLTSQPHLPTDTAARTKAKQEIDGLGRIIATLGPNAAGTLVALKKFLRGRDDAGPFEETQTLESWSDELWRTERKYFTPANNVFHTRILGPDAKRETVVDRKFDSDGRTIEETVLRYAGATARPVVKTYDVLGRMIRLERPLPNKGSTVAITKCLSATLEESTEGAGTSSARTTLREYGYFGGKRSIVRRVNALDGETKFEYDSLARAIRGTDPNGVVTIATYDSSDRQIALEVRAGNVVQSREQINYDDATRTSVSTDGRGASRVQNYDALGRLIFRAPLRGEGTTFTYDDATKPNTLSRLARVTLPGGVSFDYDYDEYGNRTRSALTIDGTTHTMRCAYTPAANIETMTYPDGTAVRNVYNAAGSLVGVEDATGARQRYATYDSFSPFGKAQVVMLRNGARETLPYNDIGQLSGQMISTTSGSIANKSIVWNELYQLAEITDDADATRTQKFTYDNAGRLIRATGDHPEQLFKYDAAGNLIEKNGVSFEVTGHQVMSGKSGGSGVFSAEYDGAGNMVRSTRSGEQREYQFDEQSQLVASGGTRFVYDHEGARIAKKSADGTTTYYIGTGFEVTSFPNGARQHTVYIAGGQGLLASVTTNETSTAAPSLAGVPTEGTYYFHTNHINSTTIQTDKNAVAVCRVEYLPFGEIHRITGRDIFRQKFTGNELDTETGLYYFKSRYYDATIGRFISSDDRLGGDMDRRDVFNRYAYVLNNPVSEFDPEGHSAGWAIFSGVMFGLAVVAGAALSVATGGMAAGAVATGLSMFAGVLIGGSMSASIYSFTHTDNFDTRRMGIEFGIGAACGVIGTGTSTIGLKAIGVALKFGEATAKIGLTQALGIAAVETFSGALVGATKTMLDAAANGRAVNAGDVGIKSGWGAAGGLLAGGMLAGGIRQGQQAVALAPNRGEAAQQFMIPPLSNVYVNKAADSVFFHGPRGAFGSLSKMAASNTGPQPHAQPQPVPQPQPQLEQPQ